jgi:hypothetical protein
MKAGITIRAHAAAAAIAGCAVIATIPALAVDGEILISQAKVNAGGISPGDTAGFPATLSRPGRYKLSGNLVVPGQTTGIDVRANDVTIDLNGFTISGNPPGAYYGVYALSVSRIRVVNGTLTGVGDAIAIGASGIIENMRLISNTHGVTGERDTVIRNSTIASNSAFGIYCFGCVVEGNVIAGNGSGVDILDEPGLVRGNVIAGNNGFGSSYGLLSNAKTGFGSNIIVGNNGGSVNAQPEPLHPNVCDPACP